MNNQESNSSIAKVQRYLCGSAFKISKWSERVFCLFSWLFWIWALGKGIIEDNN